MQALLENPDLVLLDEPFAGLDLGGCNETKRLIRALAQQGRTVILSSGSLAFTKDICDRVAVLSQGQIAATGTLEQLLPPRQAFVIWWILPQPTAERVLEMIRHDMGTRGSPSNTPLQAPERNPPGVSMNLPLTPRTTLRLRRMRRWYPCKGGRKRSWPGKRVRVHGYSSDARRTSQERGKPPGVTPRSEAKTINVAAWLKTCAKSIRRPLAWANAGCDLPNSRVQASVPTRCFRLVTRAGLCGGVDLHTFGQALAVYDCFCQSYERITVKQNG